MLEPISETFYPPRPGDDSQGPESPSHWSRIADITVFGIWLMVVGIVLQRHEPWADESQAWLLARDLDLKAIWFHELKYEGSPGLWHTILWIAQHWFGAPYAAMGPIGAACAAAGVAFILWKAPFPRPLTYLLVFSYVLFYQYAVVARSYNLLPLALFAAAYSYRDRAHPARMTVALLVLAFVSLHGSLLAVALGLCYLLEAIKEWSALSETTRTRYPFCVVTLLFAFLFLFIILKPTPDVAAFAPNPTGALRATEPLLLRLDAVVTFAFFDHWIASSLFLLLASGWCLGRAKLLPFILPVLLMLIMYVALGGRPHHHGTVFLAAVAGVWIAWPDKREVNSFSGSARAGMHVMLAVLACLFSLNVWDAVVAMRNDYLYPYSGSPDAANFIRTVAADRSSIFGYTYGMSAVQAYFDRNILANIPTTYFHEGLPLYGATMYLGDLRAAAPEYVIVFSNDGQTTFSTADPLLRPMGYSLVHVSPGYVFYKRTAFDTASYYIWRRTSPQR